MPDTDASSAVTESRAARGIFHFRPAPGKPGRLQFIDVLRGWAVLVMIETHVLNGTLNPAYTGTLLFKVLNFVNGLVAPAFLFASGLAFAIASRRKLADYLAFRWPLIRQLARLALLFIIGYGLHIPKFDYHHLRYDAGEAAWHFFAQVDVLQCIAVSLLTLQLLLLVLRSERRMYLAAGVLLAGIVVTTPLIWAIDFWKILPIPLAE
ncbi:MAG TPA: heparan-alpha-glucosaminide N-acetyltransferase domain-containing protein, partial [Bacteroidota bacterium]